MVVDMTGTRKEPMTRNVSFGNPAVDPKEDEFNRWPFSRALADRIAGLEFAPARSRWRKAVYSFSQQAVSRAMLVGDRPAASSPNNPSRAGRKSPVESPRRYKIGSTSATLGERRM